jgi:hypothetical protein
VSPFPWVSDLRTLTVGANARANIALFGASTQMTPMSQDFVFQPFAVTLAQQFGA